MPFISEPDSSRYLIIFIPYSNKGNAVFSNGPKSLPKNPPDCLILCNWVFDNFVLADELLTKTKTSKLLY